MNPPDENREYLEELYRELESLKLRIAFVEMDCEREWQPAASDAPAYSAAGVQRAVSTLREQEERSSRRSTLHRTFSRIAYVAASFILTLNVGFATAITNIPSFKIQVVEFIMNSKEEFTTLELQPVKDEQVIVPAGWLGLYFPSYIPEGYELVFIDEYPYCDVVFENKQNHKLYFSECDNSISANVDTENAINYYTTIQKQNALVSIKNGYTMIVWSAENRYFILRIQENEETALKIANSVKLIK